MLRFLKLLEYEAFSTLGIYTCRSFLRGRKVQKAQRMFRPTWASSLRPHTLVYMQEFLEGSEGSVDVSAYMVRDAELMKWKGYVFDIVTPHSKR